MKQQTFRVWFPALANTDPLFDRLGPCIQSAIDDLVDRFRQRDGGGVRAGSADLAFQSNCPWVVRVLGASDASAGSRRAVSALTRELIQAGGRIALRGLGPECRGWISFAE